MRAFQSQVLFWQGFYRLDSGFLKNGHFRNVQNRVLNFKPGKFLFFVFIPILKSQVNSKHNIPY
jgi:hypothetical protein